MKCLFMAVMLTSTGSTFRSKGTFLLQMQVASSNYETTASPKLLKVQNNQPIECICTCMYMFCVPCFLYNYVYALLGVAARLSGLMLP